MLQPALPSSPRKRQEIFKEIASTHGVIISPPKISAMEKPIQTEVLQFLYSDEVSRAAPGMRDRIIIREGKTKDTRQKRHLFCTLRETYTKFKEDHPLTKIAFSTFAAIRKEKCPEVCLSADMRHDTCLCAIHENFKK